MTRINLIHPSKLMDQHLFAEFREIKMIPRALERSLKSRDISNIISSIPQHFILNKGHVSFFYNKGLYLQQRFDSLKLELIQRKYQINQNSVFDSQHIYNRYPILYQDWEPSPLDYTIIQQRLEEKINQKPSWYRYYGQRQK